VPYRVGWTRRSPPGTMACVGMALLGAAMILYEVALWATLAARGLRHRGDPTTRAWRGAMRSLIAWLGVILLVAAVSVTAAGILMLVAAVIAVVQIARGIRDFPAVWRLLGDPAAWRGEGPPGSRPAPS
jgi:hypothetical protein